MLRFGRWTVHESHDSGTKLTNVPQDAIHWEESTNGQVPAGAVIGGKSLDNELLYIGRARLRENRNELTPGIVIPSERCLLLSFGTGVKKTLSYEVLVADNQNLIDWVPCRGGNVPPNSVIGGIDCSYLEPLYVGRTRGPLDVGRTWRGHRLKISSQENELAEKKEYQFPGKVHRTHKCLYIPYLGKEYLFRDYEVLVIRESPTTLTAICRDTIRRHLGANIVVGDSEYEQISARINDLPLPKKLKDFCEIDAAQT